MRECRERKIPFQKLFKRDGVGDNNAPEEPLKPAPQRDSGSSFPNPHGSCRRGFCISPSLVTQYPHEHILIRKKDERTESGSDAELNSLLQRRSRRRRGPHWSPAGPLERAGPPEPPIGCLGSRPSLVSVAKDAASVGCQDGGGGGVAATTAPAARNVCRRSCRRHHSRQRRRARTGAATGHPPSPVTRDPRGRVEGGAEEKAEARLERP